MNKVFKNDTHIPYLSNGDGKLYYSKLHKKYILDYYINKSLPLNGWFKECIFCYTITGRYIDYIYKKKLLMIPICKNCLALSEAPPTKAPSMSGMLNNAAALSGFTLPP